ncbi:hypothetical protein BKA81DRAFT_115974 [Phyllosticta paracitricarpa]
MKGLALGILLGFSNFPPSLPFKLFLICALIAPRVNKKLNGTLAVEKSGLGWQTASGGRGQRVGMNGWMGLANEPFHTNFFLLSPCFLHVLCFRNHDGLSAAHRGGGMKVVVIEDWVLRVWWFGAVRCIVCSWWIRAAGRESAAHVECGNDKMKYIFRLCDSCLVVGDLSVHASMQVAMKRFSPCELLRAKPDPACATCSPLL